MKKLIVCFLFGFTMLNAFAQSSKTELYNFIKILLFDSTGYENVGDWAVGNSKKFSIAWKADRLEMSPDTSINFYRLGTANITIKGHSFVSKGQPAKWNIMLKGPRMGYSSFSIMSSPCNDIPPKWTIDSIFGNKPFKATLLKSCDSKTLAGYYYYEVKFPKKDVTYLKLSWLSINGSTAIRIDCYDNWSKYAVKLDCR
jgi:hypothetical protein